MREGKKLCLSEICLLTLCNDLFRGRWEEVEPLVQKPTIPQQINKFDGVAAHKILQNIIALPSKIKKIYKQEYLIPAIFVKRIIGTRRLIEIRLLLYLFE